MTMDQAIALLATVPDTAVAPGHTPAGNGPESPTTAMI
jgi:hypothetical protein